MIIDFSSLKMTIVPQNAIDWISDVATSHVAMSKFWKANPDSEFTQDYETILYCLAYELQQETPRNTICSRLLGRARSIRSALETHRLEQELNREGQETEGDDETDPLG